MVYHNEMEIASRNVALGVIVSIAVGVAIDEYYSKGTQISDTITKNNDIVTIIKQKKNVDGSSQTDTTIIDKSKESEKLVAVLPKDVPNWFLSAGAGVGQGLKTEYTFSVSRRVLGPVFIGAWGSTEKAGGVSLGIEL